MLVFQLSKLEVSVPRKCANVQFDFNVVMLLLITSNNHFCHKKNRNFWSKTTK